MRLRIQGGRALRGSVTLPADVPIGARALLLASLAEGDSWLRADTDTGELSILRRALSALGVELESSAEGTRVHGVGLAGLRLPAGALDCGDSWTTLTLLAAALAPQPFGTRLTVDASLAGRSALDLVGVLRARGAPIAGQGSTATPPLSIAPLLAEEPLHPLECELSAPDASAKTAALVSGLFCQGPTAVSEPLMSPDHTERMLLAMGAPVERAGTVCRLAAGPARLDPVDWQLPGSAELAAYLATAATLLPDSRVSLRDVSHNPSASGFFDALRLLGGRLLAVARGDAAGNEPVVELQVRAMRLRGGAMGSEVAIRGCHLAPALALLGVDAARGIRLYDCEGFAPSGDRVWRELASLFVAFGVEATARGAGVELAAAQRPRPASVDLSGDGRLGLCAVVLALAAEGESVIEGAEGLLNAHPGLPGLLSALGAEAQAP